MTCRSKNRVPSLVVRIPAFLAVAWLGAATAPAADDYVLGPDSMKQEGVPEGKVTQGKWEGSKVFPETVRDYWVYVPAQYDGSKPAAVMVFQDGDRT